MERELKKLGLTEYEIKVYLALLKEGELTGGKLSKLSKVPHGKTYESIAKLEEKGLVSIFPSKPKIIKAMQPEIALNNLINGKLGEYNNIRNEVVPQLKQMKKFKSPLETTTEKITIFRGKKNLQPLADYFYSTPKKYLKILFTYEYLPISNIKSLQEARKRGIRVQQLATKIPKRSKEIIKEQIKNRIEIRYYPVEELRLIIKDGKQSLQQIVNPNNLLDRVSIFIESKDLTYALETYFDKIWKKAKPVKL